MFISRTRVSQNCLFAVSTTEALRLLQPHHCQLLLVKTPVYHLSGIYKQNPSGLISQYILES